jgi:hypothetical protein
MMAMGRLVDTPHIKKQIMVDRRPMMMVHFRPIESEARPQGTAVRLWEKEKTAEVMPAHFATWLSSIPKLLIISGK